MPVWMYRVEHIEASHNDLLEIPPREVKGVGFRMKGVEIGVQGVGCGVKSEGCRVWGVGCGVMRPREAYRCKENTIDVYCINVTGI